MKFLIKRHLLLFFRDRANVFFSMLAVLIAILLYVFFLADLLAVNIAATVPDAAATQVRTVMSGIILGGTVAVGTVSSSQSGIARMVIDREDVARDFHASPLKRSHLMFSYVMASSIIALIMSGLSLSFTLIYLGIRGAGLPDPISLLQLVITLIFGVISANSFMVLTALCIKSRNAFSSFGSIMGTLIGFLAGVYIPIGQLPNGIAWLINIFPTAHTASLFRQVLAGNLLNGFSAYVSEDTLSEIHSLFGITLQLGRLQTNFLISAVYLLATSIIFYALAIWKMKTQKFE